MKILHGRNLIVRADGVAIAAAKSCSLKIKAEQIEVSSPNDGAWEHSINGRKSWTLTTDHLVTTISRNAVMVGTQVSIQVRMLDNNALPFSVIVSNVTILEQSAIGTVTICWDKVNKVFCCRTGNHTAGFTYYASWQGSMPYNRPEDYAVFECQEIQYTWHDGDLSAEKLTGTANVESWEVNGSVGHLCKGSFKFNGTGPLTVASLP